MSMLEQSKQFDDATIRLLRSTLGHTLESYEAYCPFGAGNVYKTARLHFDAFDLDLVNAHEPIPLGPDYQEEELAILNADLADGSARPLWHPAGRELSAVPLDIQVNDVLVVVDTILLSKGSRRLNKLKLAQAVVFEDEGGLLTAFDRDIWSDEYLTVRTGEKISTTTRDFRGDYVAEPPYQYQFGREILRLSNPHV